ncbi:MAG TPA: DUF1501 domain-containing protein [Gemmataceae bacterium]|nr:DUF1501 domain-containing protein [Gemmataceae bacterium]
MNVHSLMQVQTSAFGVVSRRTFLRSVAAGAAISTLGWKEAITLHAAELRKKGMSCILLFMNGGPSQFETFDPKPGTTNGGPTKAISTALSGVQLAEGWENTAKEMKDIALIRSVTNKEGAHPRAVYQLHTGYLPSGAVKYPSFGAVVGKELGLQDFELPYFVNIGNRFNNTAGSGFLGMKYAPFVIGDPNKMPNNAELTVSKDRYERRLGLMKDLEEDFAAAGAKKAVEDHHNVYQNAANLVTSPSLKAFDLSQEKDAVRDQYGRSSFGQGCLLARRLVEHGVTFIEAESTGWDTHQDNFERTKTLSTPTDRGFAALVSDLKQRGLLEKTLVIWMGEFGRTPRVNGQTGRDHYPRVFSVALAGGGIKGGQVIGASSADGSDIKSRPVTVSDLFCSFCHALKINPRKENIGPLERPIKIVDGGDVVKELFA